MRIDFRFIEFGYEFEALRASIRLLEENLPKIIAAEAERARQEVGGDDEGVAAYFVGDQLNSGVVTRSLTGSSFIAAWAAYETSVTKISRSVQEQCGVALTLSDLRGSFLERARKYFGSVLGFDLHPEGTDWKRLETIAAIRHCLAHTNGEVRALALKDQKLVRNFVRSEADLRIEGEWLIVTLPFARSTVEFIEGLIKVLVDRTRSAFPKASDQDLSTRDVASSFQRPSWAVPVKDPK